MTQENQITLKELASRIECALSADFLREVWVVAEINNLNVNPGSGHCYMELIERDGLRGLTTASVKATIWANRYRMLAGYFEQTTGSKLASGMKVLCKATVSFHAMYGLSVNVSDIDPSYTIGENERQRMLTIAKLKEEGVFEMNKDLELEFLPQRIAVVSSSSAAGYGDFMHQLDNSPYAFRVTLFSAIVQGNEAESSVTNALSVIAERESDFDCVVVIRGGGSTTDLQCFDSYMIASYITQMPLPVITGIGHERDTSVADMVAHTSLKTPTAVAAFLIERADNFYNSLLYLYDKVIDHARNTIISETALTGTLASKITTLATSSLSHQQLRLERLSGQVTTQATQIFTERLNRLALYKERMGYASRHLLFTQKERVKHFGELIRAHNPRRILSLGYSIVTTEDGRTVKDASKLSSGTNLRIETHNAIIDTQITEINKKRYRNG